MPACQISFSAFAASLLASVQSEAIDCTPPVQETAPAVVAHPVVVDGGECSVGELWDAAGEIYLDHKVAGGRIPSSYMFLLNQHYARGGFTNNVSNSDRVRYYDGMVFYAHRCIQSGC